MQIKVGDKLTLVQEEKPKLVLTNVSFNLGTIQDFTAKKLLAYEGIIDNLTAYVLEQTENSSFKINKIYYRDRYSAGVYDVEAISIYKFVNGVLPFYILRNESNKSEYVFYDRNHEQFSVPLRDIVPFYKLLLNGTFYELNGGTIYVWYLLKHCFLVIDKNSAKVIITSNITDLNNDNFITMDSIAFDKFKMDVGTSKALKQLTTVEDIVEFLKRKLALAIVGG
jgi:hypothetical protein